MNTVKKVFKPRYKFGLHNIHKGKKKDLIWSDLIFFVTNKCNSKCKFCFYKNNLNKNIKELTLDEINKISQHLEKIDLLMISGGEPFLRNDLSEIINIFTKQNFTKYISIPTNGILKMKLLDETKSILERNEHILLQINVSIDGLNRLNEKLRGFPGCFQKSMVTVRELCKLRKKYSNLFVSINTTVSKDNYEGILPLYKFVKEELDVNSHYLEPARNSLENKKIRVLESYEWFKLSCDLFKYRQYYLKKHRSKSYMFFFPLGYKKYNKILASVLEGEKWPFSCVAGRKIGVIEPEGSVRLCELTERVGNLRDYDYDIKKVLMSKTAQKKLKEISIGNCSKFCTHGCFFKPSLYSSPLTKIMKLF